MTRILIQRGSSGGSSGSGSNQNPNQNQGRSGPRPEPALPVPPAGKDEECGEEAAEQVVGDDLLEYGGTSDSGKANSDDGFLEGPRLEQSHTVSGDEVADDDTGKDVKEEDAVVHQELMRGLGGEKPASDVEACIGDTTSGSSHPPPPPVPPPKPSANNLTRRNVSGTSNAVHLGSPRKAAAWPVVSARTSPAGSRPSSPRAHSENEGYNSADEQNPCLGSSYDDVEKERQFEIDIRRVKGYEVKRMLEDGNCLFRAIADQVYGDSELYDDVRQLCINYMEKERDHYSQFITEGFTSYCKRKRRDKVYGNNVEIQAICEMYNRPIHIYSYSTAVDAEPINIFQRSYNTDTPPIRLSYHHGHHYNSLVDPRRPTVGIGLGFSSLRGTNVDKDQVKAAIIAQQNNQIDNALLAEGRFYSDLELTEKEIERSVMEASRAEYLAEGIKQQLGHRESSTSNAEPSSSGATGSSNMEQGKEQDTNQSSSIQLLMCMGFTYLQAIEAYSIFGDDVDSMVCYLLETGTSSRRKGKAAE
ncbi:OTU domain-containing protein 5 isoform X1 [Arachis ipaensis]|uniref:OTU domain-containing protein 5 isoform X1 n=1 Tax=Arachis ipaensis TaxID=130454 RepID=UPI000A2B865A|nr:OTU domain-containing protein 5 isoform X1 [Arachis ipaensis]XP_025674089.1 OTU domain-containing protein 5 isoform X1 [Arachis hypogaea]